MLYIYEYIHIIGMLAYIFPYDFIISFNHYIIFIFIYPFLLFRFYVFYHSLLSF